MFTHFYHVYAGGLWSIPVQEHLDALESFGLLDNLKNMYVGYVGTPDQTKEAEEYINSRTSAITINKSETGWEQETMCLIPEMLDDTYVFYAHTKGSHDPSAINIAWRQKMTESCVGNWREAVDSLNNHDISGCYWVKDAEGNRYFGGTYWWATPAYLKTLPALKKEHRWQAEHWVGSAVDPKYYDLRAGKIIGD